MSSVLLAKGNLAATDWALVDDSVVGCNGGLANAAEGRFSQSESGGVSKLISKLGLSKSFSIWSKMEAKSLWKSIRFISIS